MVRFRGIYIYICVYIYYTYRRYQVDLLIELIIQARSKAVRPTLQRLKPNCAPYQTRSPQACISKRSFLYWPHMCIGMCVPLYIYMYIYGQNMCVYIQIYMGNMVTYIRMRRESRAPTIKHSPQLLIRAGPSAETTCATTSASCFVVMVKTHIQPPRL